MIEKVRLDVAMLERGLKMLLVVHSCNYELFLQNNGV